jgi:hypothetical protein
MNKFTPGPWRYTNKGRRAQISKLGGNQVCMLWNCPETESNANLIAAAPDMLEALEKVLEVMAEDMPVGLRKVCYDALAKARGEV